ncbi:MAG TPA: efflux RND transporter periplasmic adaptor subunit [Devosia sp.]|nr:efflux RND transporter periplasmic adaptor subunit [Devosia sp.]
MTETTAQPGVAEDKTAGKPVRRRRARRGGWWVLLALIVLAGAGWYGWTHYLSPRPVLAPQTVPVTRGDIQQTVLANGILQANSLVSVGAQVSGRIEKLDVKVGDTVKKGDLIAEIDPSDMENSVKIAQAAQASVTAQLHSAEAAVKTAQAALDRSTKLNSQGLVAQSDQETAEAAVETANAQVEVLKAQLQQANLAVDNANLNLSRTKITAPSDGTIVAVLVDAGQSVNAVQTSPTIAKLADLSTMVIKAQISEADVPRVKPGQKVYFTILGEPDNKIGATLLSVNPAPDSVATDSDNTTPSTNTAIYYNGLFQVPNTDGKLRIDMTAQVTIVLNESKDALIVPSSALTKTPRGDYLAAVYDPATGKTEPKRVSVGINNNVTAEITDGLNEGDRVVATGVAFGAFRGQGGGARQGNGQAGGNGGQPGARGPGAGGFGRFVRGGGPLGL